MPLPPPSRPLPGPRRRTLLASAAGAALLVGCSSGAESQVSTGGGPSVAERARARAARDSRGLVERYDAVIAAFPGLAERLTPLRMDVGRHVAAFGASTASPSPRASASASPGTEKDALAWLAAGEKDVAARRGADLLEVPGELARLLASVAAAGAVHVFLLTEGGE